MWTTRLRADLALRADSRVLLRTGVCLALSLFLGLWRRSECEAGVFFKDDDIKNAVTEEEVEEEETEEDVEVLAICLSTSMPLSTSSSMSAPMLASSSSTVLLTAFSHGGWLKTGCSCSTGVPDDDDNDDDDVDKGSLVDD